MLPIYIFPVIRKFILIQRFFFFVFFSVIIVCNTDLLLAQCGTVISAFPYHEDFEISSGGWTSGGTNNDWAWGTPSKPLINSAGSGTKCWITGGTSASFYNFSERSYVESPCFNFSILTNPFISLKIFWDTEYTYDGANLQYSTNGGANWINVGAYGDATDYMNANWYNYANINNLSTLTNVKNGWCGTVQPSGGGCVGGGGNGTWLIAKHTMPYLAGQASVKFRFAFGAGTTCNGYDGFAFDDITIKNAALPITVVPILQPAGCTVNDGSATLTVNGGVPAYSYLWNPNVSITNSATGLGAGNYTVTISDATGCNKVSSFSIVHTPDVTFDTITSPDTCNRGVGMAKVFAQNGTPPFAYLWSWAANTTASINNLIAGTYNIKVTDSKGCAKSESVSIENVGDFTIDLGSDTTICSGNGFYLNPGKYIFYEWQDLSNDSAYHVIASGLYSVEVIAANGCRASDTIEVIEDCLHDVVLPNAFSPNEDGRNDIFKAETVTIKSFSINIYNRWGQVIFKSNSINNGWDGRFKSSKCESAIYFWVAVYSPDGLETKEKKGTLFLIR
jgi:gliding motility-associated-like protein